MSTSRTKIAEYCAAFASTLKVFYFIKCHAWFRSFFLQHHYKHLPNKLQKKNHDTCQGCGLMFIWSGFSLIFHFRLGEKLGKSCLVKWFVSLENNFGFWGFWWYFEHFLGKELPCSLLEQTTLTSILSHVCSMFRYVATPHSFRTSQV